MATKIHFGEKIHFAESVIVGCESNIFGVVENTVFELQWQWLSWEMSRGHIGAVHSASQYQRNPALSTKIYFFGRERFIEKRRRKKLTNVSFRYVGVSRM